MAMCPSKLAIYLTRPSRLVVCGNSGIVRRRTPTDGRDCSSPSWYLGFIGGLLGSRFHVCKHETITKGAETTVTNTCGAPGVSDAEVVAIALFVVLLLVPDMSEVGVFGVSLKRRLAAAEEKASESIAKAENLQHQLQVQSLRVETLTQNLQDQLQLQSLRVDTLTQNAAAAAANSRRPATSCSSDERFSAT
jgi:hypothetical protein